MSLNLVQSIQKNLGYAELKKIDPNTKQTVDDNKEEDKLNQAAIPAVLIVLYKYTRSDIGAEQVLASSMTNDWIESMLGDETHNATDKVAAYGEVTEVTAQERMEQIAKQAIGLIQASKPANPQAVKDIMNAEKNNILVYLPPALHIGDLLNDTTIDDESTKMEGPVSSFMSAIGSVFSQSERAKEN